MEDEEEGKLGIGSNGTKRWYDKHNRCHRLNGPAVIYADVDMDWCRHGKLHRDDGPARIWPSVGVEDWWKDGEPYEPSAHELMVWKMKQKNS
jgi:hypothetical protein